jgi:NAD/NADP transhydrogenase beta subunit
VTLSPQTIGPLIGIVVFGAVMAFRFSRARKARPLKLEWMWVLPAVLVLATASLLWQMPPHGFEWAWLVLAFAIGGAIGWYRGRMMTITVDPATHDLNQQASPAALIFLVALVAVRYALREGLSAEAQAWHLSAAFLTDVFVVFAMGLLSVTRLEMFIRARRLLTDARAAKTA